MVQTKIDKRVQKTRQALRSALLELIVERGYERLSVQHILDSASVGRATFYLHYRSKEDLLRSSLDQLREQLTHELPPASGAKSAAPLSFSLAFFRHVDGHRKLYRAIVGRESGLIVEKEIRRILVKLVREEIISKDRRVRDGVPIELASQYVAGALMSLVTWWLDRSIKLSADEIDRAFRRMTLPALSVVKQ